MNCLRIIGSYSCSYSYTYTYYLPSALPRHTHRALYCWILAVCYGIRNNTDFIKNAQNTTESGLGLHGGLVTTYPTTTRRLVTGRKSSGAKSYNFNQDHPDCIRVPRKRQGKRPMNVSQDGKQILPLLTASAYQQNTSQLVGICEQVKVLH